MDAWDGVACSDNKNSIAQNVIALRYILYFSETHPPFHKRNLNVAFVDVDVFLVNLEINFRRLYELLADEIRTGCLLLG